VLDIYRRIEDWHGVADPDYRGTGGPVFVQPCPDPSPIAPALLEGARAAGIPTFENQNGRMMESVAGASIIDLCARDGHRQSMFRSYVSPLLHRPNLRVITGALVTRLTFRRTRATGVEFLHDGELQRVSAGSEVVLSLGAINTPKVLMQSGIGDQADLGALGIPVVQHLPGVGQNLQDHVAFASVWEYRRPLPPRNSGCEATYFSQNDPSLEGPDLQACQSEFPLSTAETAAEFSPPDSAWTLLTGVLRPKSRGFLRLTGPDAWDPILIQPNMLMHPDDVKTAVAGVQLSREIANSAALRPFVKREVMPAKMEGNGLESFVRNAASTYWHQTCTAKMGQDVMSVVDGRLKVYGIDGLRIADGSIMPRVTTGNTMAPCVIIGERAAQVLRAEHSL
jgi:choline dehydrogenase